MNSQPNAIHSVTGPRNRFPIGHSVRLHSWRVSDARWPWRLRSQLLLLMALATLFFLQSLWSPFTKPEVRLLVVRPALPMPDDSDDGLNRDMARELAYGNGNFVHTQFQGYWESSLVGKDTPVSLLQSVQALQESLPKKVHRNTTLIVYISGILSLDRVEPSLCASSRDSVHAGTHVELLALVEQLQKLHCRQVILCVDAQLPSTTGPSNIAASLVIENMREMVEEKLVHDTRTPVAVQLYVNEFEFEAPLQEFPSKIALGISHIINRDKLAITTSLSSLQKTMTDPLRAVAADDDDTTSMPWIESPHWPVEQQLFVVPSFQAGHTRTASRAAIAEANAIDVSTKEESVDQLTRESRIEEWLSLADTVVTNWQVQPTFQQVPLLDFPQPLSRQQAHPVAARWIGTWIRTQQLVMKTSPESMDAESIRQVVQAIQAIDKNQAVASDAPKWLQHLQKCMSGRTLQKNPSIIVDQFGRGMAMESNPSNESPILRLVQLVTRLTEEANSDFTTWFESLPAETMDYEEFVWAKQVLSMEDAPWSIQRKLIIARMLATRLECDPLAESGFGDSIRLAQSFRIQAERWTDRSRKDWQEQWDECIQSSLFYYSKSIKGVGALRRAREYYSRAIGELSTWRPWNGRTNLVHQDHDLACNRLSSLFALSKAMYQHPSDSIETMTQLANELEHDPSAPTAKPTPRHFVTTPIHPIAFNASQILEPHEETVRSNHSECLIAMRQYAYWWYSAVSCVDNALANRTLDQYLKTRELLIRQDTTPHQALDLVSAFVRDAHLNAEGLIHWLRKNHQECVNDCPIWLVAFDVMPSQREELLRLLMQSRPLQGALAESVAKNLEWERNESTAEEEQGIDRRAIWWAKYFGASSGPMVVRKPIRPEIQAPHRLDLSSRASTSFPITIRGESGKPMEMEVRFDATEIELTADNRPIQKGQFLAMLENDPREAGLMLDTWSKTFQVRSLGTSVPRQPIVMVVSQGSQKRRACIFIDRPHETIAGIQLESGSQDSGEVSRSSSKPRWQTDANTLPIRLYPNRPNPISVQLTNQMPVEGKFSVFLHSTPGPIHASQIGSLSSEEAAKWVAQIRGIKTLCSSQVFHFSPAESRTIHFAPAPWPADQEKPIVSDLLIEVREETKGLVQFFQGTVTVVIPTEYVVPHVTVHARSHVLTADFEIPEKALHTDRQVDLQLHLVDRKSLQVLGAASAQLHRNRISHQVQLTTSPCLGKPALLSVSVDRWPHCFLYEVDPHRDGVILPSHTFAAMRLSEINTHGISRREDKDVEVQLDAWMTTTAFQTGKDSILVGIDRNADRNLEGDVALSLSSLHSTRFLWSGIAPSGKVEMESVVQPHRVHVPIQMDWDRRASILAVLQRGRESIYSPGLPLVFDRLAPRILSARVLGSELPTIGVPLNIDVQIDDLDLAGGESVEGGWSWAGELEFTPQVKRMAGIYAGKDRWKLTMPTENFASGYATLLISSRDRAGNVSKTFPLEIELLTKEERARQIASRTTIVVGDVMFGKQPLKGLHVALVRPVKVDESRNSSPDSSEKTSGKETSPEVVSKTTTDQAGQFLLHDVRSGDYVLEVEGIVRGMRQKRTQKIQIIAPTAPPRIHVRLDQKP